MLNEKDTIRTSKFLSLILRHQPETIGIQLDANGWTDIDTLIGLSKKSDIHLTREILQYVVDTNPKKRFAISEDSLKIRASQGHSVNVDLGYENEKPPEILYHGTAEQSAASISKEGIVKGQRQEVHLSRDIDTARKVGQRHGKPFIFKILAAKMYADGFVFHLSDNDVWLTDFVPAKYLEPL